MKPNIVVDPNTFEMIHANRETHETFVIKGFWSRQDDAEWLILRNAVEQIKEEIFVKEPRKKL